MKKITLIFAFVFIEFLLLAQTDFSFVELTNTGIPTNDSTRIESFDFNNDGRFDFIAYDFSAGKLTVHSNYDSISFKQITSLDINHLYAEEMYLMAGDYDADLYTDLLVMLYAADNKRYIYVYKNNRGKYFTEAFTWNTGMADGEDISDRFVFMDVDRDNDLDIVSGEKIFVFNGSTFKEPRIVENWPDIQFRNSKFYNSFNLGGANLYYENLVTNDGTSYKLSLEEKSDSVLIFNPKVTEQSYDIDDVVYLDVDNDGFLDKIWIEYNDNVFIKYASTLHQNEMIACEIPIDGDFQSFSWALCGIKYYNQFDLVYSIMKNNTINAYYARSGEGISWDTEGINKIESAKPFFTRYGQTNEIKVTHFNDGHAHGFIIANHIFLIDRFMNANRVAPKPFDLETTYDALDDVFIFKWQEQSPEYYTIVRNEIKISNDFDELSDLFTLPYVENTSIPPYKTFLNTPDNRYQTNVADTGWVYWTVRSMNCTYTASEWADIDSFYVSPVKVFGPNVVCGQGSTAEFQVKHTYDIVDSIEWHTDGNHEELLNADGFYKISFSDVGDYHLWAILYDSYYDVVDSLNCYVKVKKKPVISISYVEMACEAENVQIQFNGVADDESLFSWDFGNGLINSGEGIGPFDVSWNIDGINEFKLLIESEGCENVDSTFSIDILKLPDSKSLCGVGVNSYNHAVPFWSPVTDENVDSVYIYKETTQVNSYVKIAAVEASISEFTDVNTDCSTQPYRYKISLFDNACAYQTPLSDEHKTIHLMLNKGLNATWNLLWTAYEGLEIGTYSIYRGSAQDNLFKIAEVAGNVFSYTDHNAPLGDLYYAIVAENYFNDCTVDVKSVHVEQQDIRSNIQSTEVFSGLNEHALEAKYKINVSKKVLFITTDLKANYDLRLYDITGKKLFEKTLNSTFEKDLSMYNSGMLLIQLSTGNGIITEKIMVK